VHLEAVAFQESCERFEAPAIFDDSVDVDLRAEEVADHALVVVERSDEKKVKKGRTVTAAVCD